MQTFANPDGTFTTEMADGPVRVEQKDGSWKDLDLDLVPSEGGGLTQKASPAPATFSSGGSGPLAETTIQGRSIQMRWPGGDLPKPTIEGNVATYAVSPTEDLVLTATRTGFEQSLVLKERPTQMPTVNLPLSVDGLDVKADNRGGFAFTATKASGKAKNRVAVGDTIAAVAPPVMYSAAVDKNGNPTQVKELKATLGLGADGKGHQLSLSPGAAGMTFLNDPMTKYPVTIDPVIASVAELGDTWIQNGSSTAQFASPYLATGLQTAATRSLIRFNTNPIMGQHVTSASLRLWQHVSNTCAAKTTYAYPISEAYTNPSVVWSNQPAINTSTSYRGSATFNWGFDASCNRAFGTIDVTNMATAWAWGQIPSHGIELRTGSETDASFAKSFCSFDSPASGTCATLNRVPTLSVTYNSYPWTPQNVTATPQTAGTNGTTYVTATQPEIQARIGNTDGALVTPQAEISYDPAYPGEGSGVFWTGSGAPTTPSTTSAVKVATALTHGKHYRYRIRASVASGTNGTDWGPWSDYTAFAVHTATPAEPSISCPSYPADSWTAASGGSVTCTLSTPTSDGAGYQWSLDNPTPSTLVDNGSNNGSSQTFTMNPGEGYHTLYARTRNVALSLSTVKKYTFGVGAGGVITPANGAQTQRSVALSAQSNSARTQVAYQYRQGTDTGTAWTNVPTTDVTPAGSSTPIGSWPQAGTVSGSVATYAALTWNVAATIAAANGSDGIVQVRACFTQAGANQACDNGTTINLAKTAFSATAATSDIGPGTVSLVTGDFAADEDDVSEGGLTISRTHTSLAPSAANTGPSGVFGAGWTVSAFGPAAGSGDQSLDDQSAKGFVTVVDSSGTKSTYVKNGTSYTGIGDAADGSVLTKSTTIKNPVVASDTTNYTGWQLSELDGTVTTYTQLGTSSTYLSKWVDEAGQEAESTYVRDANGRITRILAPVPDSVSCTTLVAGCQALNITYATSTTATGTAQAAWGDYTGLVKSISFTAYNPDTSAMATTDVAKYSYDNTGRLRAEWDPRITPNLVTTYAYNAQGRLQTWTDPGRAPWTIAYDSTGRLSTVARTDPANGNAVQTVAYDIPLSGAGAPIDLSGTATATWNQSTDLPVVGAAVFPASRVPSLNGNGAATPAAADWPYADLTYTDIDGRVVNTAAYGASAWQVNSTRYDATGNVIWELSDRNRAQALNPTSDTDPYVAYQSISAARADLLSTQNVYTADGVDLKSSTGPAHRVYLAAGVLSTVRVRTAMTYDEGAPTNTGYHLVTTTKTANVPLDGLATTAPDTVTALSGYDPIDGTSATGPTSGWTLRAPTTQTTVMGTSPGSDDIVTKTRYDNAGRTIESRQPASSGTDAGTTLSTYYTAAANSAAAACGNKPQWAGSACRTELKSQPGGTTLPATLTTYTRWGGVDTVTESSGTSTRTTQNQYDAAGRLTSTANTASPAADAGAALPTVTTSYNATTGDATSWTTGSTSISAAYNTIGQQTSYTDADGTSTAMTYTIDGQIKTRSDGKGTYAYTYDGTDALGQTERRGLVTSLNVGMGSAPATFTAGYDQAGNLVRQNYPNNLQANTRYDNTENQTWMGYNRQGSNWMTYDTAADRDGRALYYAGPLGLTQYEYDNAGRLINVFDRVNGQCTTRKYTFDKNGNRTALKTGLPADDGDCQSATLTTKTSTFDTADRITDTGYTYDKFGRTLTVPATDVTGASQLTAGYYVNDMVNTLTQGDATKTFTLDPARRLRQATDKTSSTESRRIINHYADTGDSPSWIETSTDAGATSTWERNVIGIDGNLAAIQPSTGTIQLQLTNLHGDIVATVDNDAAAVSTNAYFEQTEYGAPRVDNPSSPTRYGWLGGKLRSVDAMGGFVLMGVRLYVPRTARFLSIDPVLGGNENAYVYPNDPVNKFDITGMCWSWAKNACRRFNDMKRHPNYVNVKTSAQVGWGVYGVIDPFKKGIVKNLRHPKKLLSWGKKTCKGSAIYGCAASALGAGGLKSSWKSYRKSMKYGQEWRRQGTITGRDAVERKYGYR